MNLTERLRYRRWRRNIFWGMLFDQLGGRRACVGLLRSKHTVCYLLKDAERKGYYQ
jgi:hypothetical protein